LPNYLHEYTYSLYGLITIEKQSGNLLDCNIFLQLWAMQANLDHREVRWEGLIMFSKQKHSGTYVLYGCHLLRCLYNILYFLWLYNEIFIILYTILNIAETRGNTAYIDHLIINDKYIYKMLLVNTRTMEVLFRISA
jgi:hypothetical protein